MREELGRAPSPRSRAAGRCEAADEPFGKEADWERISGNFVINPSKLMEIGWRPSIATHDGIVAMMRGEAGASLT